MAPRLSDTDLERWESDPELRPGIWAKDDALLALIVEVRPLREALEAVIVWWDDDEAGNADEVFVAARRALSASEEERTP